MIHDLDLIVAKYSKPKIKDVKFSSNKYGCVDEIEVILSYPDFDIKLFSSWTDIQKETPITTSIYLIDKEDGGFYVKCDDYIIRKESLDEDAFFIELNSFLESVKSGRTPYGLDIYLDTLEVAFDIIDIMKNRKQK